MNIFEIPRVDDNVIFQEGIINLYGVNLCEMWGHQIPSINLNDYTEKEESYYRDDPEVTKLFNKAVIATKKEKYKNAICWYQDALTHENENKEHILFNMANCLMRISEFEKALLYYKQAISLASDQESWQRCSWNLAIAKENIKEREKRMRSMKFPIANDIEKELIKATEKIIIDQLDCEAWFDRGLSLLALAKWDQAIHAFNQVLLLDKFKHEAWYLRDYAYVKNRELIGAK